MNTSYGSLVVKIIIALLLGLVILVFGLVGSIFVSLFGGALFYGALMLALTGVAILFTFFYLFIPPWHRRKLHISLMAAVLLMGLASAGYEIRLAYHNSIPVVSDQEVDMEQYRPFMDHGNLAELEEPSTLKLTSDLPRMDGATALYPLYAAFAQEVYPNRNYPLYDSEVSLTQTPEAYKRLIKGEVDIIFVAPPSEGQKSMARRNGRELKLTPIGREAFVFFVNGENPVEGLTTEQIRGIYSGEITRWNQVGGGDKAIRAFQRPEDSGSQTMLERIMDGRKLTDPPRENRVSGMGGIIKQTADYRNYKNALGFSFLFYATEMVRDGDIRLLSIDGVMPERTTIANGEYPLATEFYAVTAGSDNPNIDPLIEWILSPQGQELVELTGYTPLNP
ncbi:substrate-binding domain-containing protein [Paenibacillus sanguinis]|uniref:substrate-binding domain-containing protein n=1 Tax=Paenibacillus sanguinis TaxID=225906 RepID=UPI00037D1660|nr:substrate-binding domain-containing protein [Paenibacillus sanguinis]